MKKGQVYEGVIESVEFPNKGIVNVSQEDRCVIVKNGVPGQKVRFSVNKVKKGKAEGRLLEVIEKAPQEIEPACPHFGQCGGCTYQNLPYEEQVKLKESQVKAMMDEAVDGDYIWEGVLESPVKSEYRNKMEFSFGDEYKDGPLALGMHKRGSFHDIVNVCDCQIVDGDYRKILACTLECARKSGLPYYHRMRHDGYFRHLLVRKAVKTEEILIDIVTASEEGFDSKPKEFLDKWAAALQALELTGRIVGILHTKNDSLADIVKDEGTEVLFGQDYFYEELLGLKFKITPFSFFQTNSLGAEVLYEKAREYIGDTNEKVVFDLYSGTGTIAQILAPVAKKVVGVEIVEEAVEAAKVNAKLNGLDNCTFWAGDVLKVIDELGEVPDLIMLDPPRDGVNPKALMKILNFGVDRLVYIACKPTSLARDLEMIQGRGYKVEKIACVDLFPNTVHVETVVLLSQQKPDDTIEIDLDLDELDATSAELKATYQEIKDYVLKEFGLKVSSLYISQVKRKCGIEVGENYNLPKSENARVPQCPKEKEDAIKAALKYYAMI
ncbi:23S rRNA (uracil(1939)-C(5))-methyltransferase RlmD [Dorea formicigenerans]|uniref:23S rRNA (uracil(1939)-C(5))-methyltransferase RlmD n=1 Tax=Dorea formicigenerans TaxID=39486 RepID=UPI001D0A6D9D|nr:23S rRNA (uracil(1939)-C(5))-methyltransferase RlmD [Dorea formicigenerans]MCB8576191.1 23S rRNA (uracil(1939)-C(5))-methyltransferase RlmD [Dorea formicigenerans]MCG4711228.1 23S rRNA (uracil(1939)-C(5))-methyltransferase RlmD [Dorea formicigenerans]